MEYTFFVAGRPSPGGSKSGYPFQDNEGRLRVRMAPASKYTKQWMQTVAATARNEYTGPCFAQPIILEFKFTLARPKKHYRTGKFSEELRADAPDWHETMPDLTKLIRSTEDALKGIVFVDDALVVQQKAQKLYSVLPGVSITVKEMK